MFISNVNLCIVTTVHEAIPVQGDESGFLDASCR